MTTRTASSPRIGRIATLEQLAHAYPELVRRVLRYLLARCDVDHAAAEDAAHDAIEDIARRALRGETVEHPVTFACARARNALRNEQRAAARLVERLTTDRPYGRVRVERRARVDDEQRQALRDQLTAAEFEALELRLRALTIAQAAARLGVALIASTRAQSRRSATATRGDRVRAMRAGELSLRLCLHWASRAPEEVPLLDGEWEFIAVHTPDVADLDDEHRSQRPRVTESLIRCPHREDAGERPGSDR